jgi:cytochrome P450
VLIIIYLTLYFREDLSKMEYLGCCLKEALRLHSPVPFIMRQITKEVEIEGIKFTVGLTLSIWPFSLKTYLPWSCRKGNKGK